MPKLCFVTTSKGRLAHLRESLPRMVAQADCSCVVVDYSCPDGSGDWVEANHPGVRVVRVPDQQGYHASAARNAGASVADAPWIAFVDADVCLEPGFAEAVLPLLQTGHYYRPHPVANTGVMGTFLCEREALDRVGGYDEVYRGWGHEDMDVFWTLNFAGLQRASFPSALLRHIDHADEDRTRFHEVKNLHLIGIINHLYRVLKFDVMRMTQGTIARPQRDEIYAQVVAFVKGSARVEPSTFRVQMPTFPMSCGVSLNRILEYRVVWPPGGKLGRSA
jgi:hypothetical protein